MTLEEAAENSDCFDEEEDLQDTTETNGENIPTVVEVTRIQVVPDESDCFDEEVHEVQVQKVQEVHEVQEAQEAPVPRGNI